MVTRDAWNTTGITTIKCKRLKEHDQWSGSVKIENKKSEEELHMSYRCEKNKGLD